jgi:hypothetical protein
MQDFSLPTASQFEAAITRRLTDEQLMASPVDMYLYSLAIRDRLPENLHQAMLMWSFDPKQNEHVQAYLTWATSCKERKVAKERWEKKFARNERIMKVLMIALGASLFAMFITGLLK